MRRRRAQTFVRGRFLAEYAPKEALRKEDAFIRALIISQNDCLQVNIVITLRYAAPADDERGNRVSLILERMPSHPQWVYPAPPDKQRTDAFASAVGLSDSAG